MREDGLGGGRWLRRGARYPQAVTGVPGSLFSLLGAPSGVTQGHLGHLELVRYTGKGSG